MFFQLGMKYTYQNGSLLEILFFFNIGQPKAINQVSLDCVYILLTTTFIISLSSYTFYYVSDNCIIKRPKRTAYISRSAAAFQKVVWYVIVILITFSNSGSQSANLETETQSKPIRFGRSSKYLK